MHGNGYVEDCTSHTRIEGISPELYHQVLGHWFSGGAAVGGARVNRGKNMKTAEAQSRMEALRKIPSLCVMVLADAFNRSASEGANDFAEESKPIYENS